MKSSMSQVKPLHVYVFVCGEEYYRVNLQNPREGKYENSKKRQYDYKLSYESSAAVLVLKGKDFEFKRGVKDRYAEAGGCLKVSEVKRYRATARVFSHSTQKYLEEVHDVVFGLCGEGEKVVTLFTHWGGGDDNYVNDIESLVGAVLSLQQEDEKSILFKDRGEWESFAMSSKRSRAYHLFTGSPTLNIAVCNEIYMSIKGLKVMDVMFEMCVEWQKQLYKGGRKEQDKEDLVCSYKISANELNRLRDFLEKCTRSLTAWCEKDQVSWVKRALDDLNSKLLKDPKKLDVCEQMVALMSFLIERFDEICKCIH